MLLNFYFIEGKRASEKKDERERKRKKREKEALQCKVCFSNKAYAEKVIESISINRLKLYQIFNKIMLPQESH